eukprot:CAMPEP_0116870562 /NCGR_PEP_ID=MMETSP0463-20121206/501_1 /TAXON_ID=181622 /ORGANISM="Strombidinopsis sp, Strain SopsisLIS2011" /LENGTH=43 /DNA_ID= /DNA_START= /DNA_END= /DNA_ORIENTATION=
MTSIVRVCWNFYTGFSGMQFVHDVMFASYTVNVTFYAFWNFFE